MGVENYHVIELVGEGSFGKVYKGRRKYTGQTVAMKFIMKHGKTEKDIHNLRQEIELVVGGVNVNWDVTIRVFLSSYSVMGEMSRLYVAFPLYFCKLAISLTWTRDFLVTSSNLIGVSRLAFFVILRKLKHENIIQMLDSFESPQEFCVVTEFAQYAQLADSGTGQHASLEMLSC
ncbi:uncharacterized protein LOC133300038 [Gastrolobium bilobum]|uniref:uncharacterized protein LOC133300038 n=1 Tax=Gastrolobium bilobum TaxID=150636 RepID=UPI002AAF5A7B|nr:uncharacterized protein LOC133300038 [Gastrolobium bilobum]